MEVHKDIIAENLATAVVRRCSELSTPQVVRILGLPACGKSSLANALAAKLQVRGCSSVIYEDAFEMELSREQRQLQALSGIDYESFDLTSLMTGLGALLEGRSTEIQPYVHGTGRAEEHTRVLSPADVIILDGFAWQHPVFRALLDLRVCFTISLLPGSFDLWRDLSIERDIRLRGYTKDHAYQEFACKQATFLAHVADLPVEQLDMFYLVRSQDQMREIGDQYVYEAGDQSKQPPLDIDGAQKRHVFLAFQFSDDELVNGLRLALIDKGYVVLEGNLIPGSISKGILNRIQRSAAFIGVFTHRDSLKAGGHTSSSWLLEEKGAALMARKPVLLMVEEGVDQHYAGYLQADTQRIDFNRNSFASKVWDAIDLLPGLLGRDG